MTSWNDRPDFCSSPARAGSARHPWRVPRRLHSPTTGGTSCWSAPIRRPISGKSSGSRSENMTRWRSPAPGLVRPEHQPRSGGAGVSGSDRRPRAGCPACGDGQGHGGAVVRGLYDGDRRLRRVHGVVDRWRGDRAVRSRHLRHGPHRPHAPASPVTNGLERLPGVESVRCFLFGTALRPGEAAPAVRSCGGADLRTAKPRRSCLSHAPNGPL